MIKIQYLFTDQRLIDEVVTMYLSEKDYEPTYDNLGRITSVDTDSAIAKFDYTYTADENNIWKKTFDHRSGNPYNEYTYDDIDRETMQILLIVTHWQKNMPLKRLIM